MQDIIESAVSEPKPLVPCKNCPWRRTTKTEDIPGGGMCLKGTRDLSERAGRLSGSAMACHRTDKTEACAGYVASEEGQHDLVIRFAVVTGQIPTMKVADVEGGLYPTLLAMRRAHKVA